MIASNIQEMLYGGQFNWEKVIKSSKFNLKKKEA